MSRMAGLGSRVARAAAIVLAGAMAAGAATTYYVEPNGDDTRTGLSWDQALKTISNGVAKALSAGDVVLVSNGAYVVTAEVDVPRGITVQSFGGEAVVNGNYPVTTNRCFTLNHAGAVVDGFVITNGCTTNRGGGVLISEGTLRRCTVTGNLATNLVAIFSGGGGVYITTSGTVDHCVIRGNTVYPAANVSGGGGLYIGAFATIVNSTVTVNRVSINASRNNCGGGGIFWSGLGVMTNCVLEANSVSANTDYGGGGLYARQLTATVDTCRVVGNSSGNNGGGVIIENVANTYWLTLTNCVVRDNWAANQGGGLHLRRGSWVRNCLVTSNAAVTGGGVVVGYENDIVVGSEISSNVTSGSGGGAYINYGHLRDCLVKDNIANDNSTGGGGGLCFASANSVSVVSNCVIRNNLAPRGYGGGGVIFKDGGSVVVDSLIVSNTAQMGAGARFNGGTGLLIRCWIISNVSTSTTGGGGAYLDRPGIFSNCVIFGNTTLTGTTSSTGGGGGGVNVQVAGPFGARLYNCLLTGNQARRGGGLYTQAAGTYVELHNCTLSTNTGYQGGGLWFDNASSTSLVVNTILYGNLSTLNAATLDYNISGANVFSNCLVGTGGGVYSGAGNITNRNPLFLDAVGGDYQIDMKSPCREKGTFESWMTGATDVAGNPRIRGDFVDIGAYEAPRVSGSVFVIR